MKFASFRFESDNSERGAGSLLFIAGLLPFVCIILFAAIDLSVFLGKREEIQQVLDQAARSTVRRVRTVQELDHSVRTELAHLSPLFVTRALDINLRSGDAKLILEGEYHSTLVSLVRSFVSAEIPPVSFVLKSRISNMPVRVVFIVNRIALSGSDPCNDPTWIAIQQFVQRLSLAFKQLGNATSEIAILPGRDGQLIGSFADVVSTHEERCDQPIVVGAEGTDAQSVKGYAQGVLDTSSLLNEVTSYVNREQSSLSVTNTVVLLVDRVESPTMNSEIEMVEQLRLNALVTGLHVDYLHVRVSQAKDYTSKSLSILNESLIKARSIAVSQSNLNTDLFATIVARDVNREAIAE